MDKPSEVKNESNEKVEIQETLTEEVKKAPEKEISKPGCILIIIICLLIGACMFGGDDEDEDNHTVDLANAPKIEDKATFSTNNDYYQAWKKQQFSAWDGSFRIGEKILISTMNDPDSYKMLETRMMYYNQFPKENRETIALYAAGMGYPKPMNGDFVVTIKFSGKNAYGGRVPGVAMFLVYFNGYHVGPSVLPITG